MLLGSAVSFIKVFFLGRTNTLVDLPNRSKQVDGGQWFHLCTLHKYCLVLIDIVFFINKLKDEDQMCLIIVG